MEPSGIIRRLVIQARAAANEQPQNRSHGAVQLKQRQQDAGNQPHIPHLDRVWELLIPEPTQMVQGQVLYRERLQVGIRRETLRFFYDSQDLSILFPWHSSPLVGCDPPTLLVPSGCTQSEGHGSERAHPIPLLVPSWGCPLCLGSCTRNSRNLYIT